MAHTIEQTVEIDAEPDVVFEALLSPDLLRRWLCHEAEVDPRVGGRYEMRWSTLDNATPVRYEGSAEIAALEHGKRLALRLVPGDGPSPESTVEFQVDPVDGQTRLRLVHTGFGDDAEGRKAHDGYDRGWRACLSVLRSLLEDEPQHRLASASMHRDVPIPGQDPCGIAWDGQGLWLSDSGRGRIFRLDPVSGRAMRSFVFEGEPTGLAWDGEALWQGEREERAVVRLDPASGRVLKRLEAGHVQGELTGVAWDGQYLWVGDGGEFDGKVHKVHPRTGIVYQKLEVTPGVSGLAWDGQALWVADFEARTLLRVHPRTGAVMARVAVKGHPTGLTWDGQRLWYADAEWKLVSRILDDLVH